MVTPFWNVDTNWLNRQPRSVLEDIISSDLRNLERATAEFSEDLSLIDGGLVLFVELMQVATRNSEQVTVSPTLRSALAMGEALFNYLMLARYSVLLGYLPEARGVRRDIHERITRCLLFGIDERSALRFLSGERVTQSEVDSQLAPYLQGGVEVDQDVYRTLRDTYAAQSEVAHPNLESLAIRRVPPTQRNDELTNRVGLEPFLGGFLSREMGHAGLVSFSGLVLEAAGALASFVQDRSGRWIADYNSLRDKYSRLMEELEQTLGS